MIREHLLLTLNTPETRLRKKYGVLVQNSVPTYPIYLEHLAAVKSAKQQVN